MRSLDADRVTRQIAALLFADETQAGRAAEEVERCAVDLGLDRDAFATVICAPDGGHRLTTSRRPRAPAHWGRFWATLFGAVAGREAPAGLDPAFCDRLEAALRPGTSALLMAIDPVLRPRLLRALAPYGGEVLLQAE